MSARRSSHPERARKAASARDSRLPAEPDVFVAREDDLARLDELYASGERLVTLVGPGGMGKTRLSVRWARAKPARFAGGVFFADVEAARDVASLCARVALVLDVPSGGTDDPVERLARQLAGHGDVLLVLDNFEQLVDEAAAALARMHELAPRAFLLVTSREALRVRGEVRVELSPIGLPALDAPVDELYASEAMRLLADRVARVRGTWSPDEEELRNAARLVRKLDGMPLAIELAAARLAHAGTASVLAKLESTIDALGSGPRDGAARQRTMRGTIEWSLGLLDPRELDTFALVAVFAGGFELDAAEAILPLEGAAELVASLVDKSLLRAWEVGAGGGSRRVGLYDTIRTVALERLDAHPLADQARRRHAQYYVERCETLARAVERGGDRAAMDRLALMQDDLAAAADQFVRAGATTLAARAVLALAPILSVQGLYLRLLDFADPVLAALGDRPTVLRAELLARRAVLLNAIGRRVEGCAALESAVELAKSLGDRALEGRLLRELARSLFTSDERAARAIEEAVVILRDAGDPRELGIALDTKGVRAYEVGRIDDAEELVRESIRLLHGAGDARWEGIAHCQLAICMLDRGRWEEARATLEDARRCAEKDGAWNVSVMVDQARGALEHALGRLEAADALYASAVAVHRRVGNPPFAAMYVGYRGIVARERGETERARALLTDASAELRDLGERHHRIVFLAHLGATLADLDRAEDAVRSFAEVDRIAGEGPEYGGVARVIELTRAHVALCRARKAAADGDEKTEEAERRVATKAAGALADIVPGIDERLAARALDRALSGTRAAATELPARPSAGALVIQREARFLEPPGAARVALTTRHLVRRLLLALVAARRATPGKPLPPEDLLRAGWPDERMHPDSARNRLHVAISTLRKLGLAELLIRDGDGYYLDPAVDVAFVE